MSHQRVIWSDGLYLRPQHFQQQERWIERLVAACTAGALAPGWGFTHLRLDPQAAACGRVALLSARGLLPDGTPFDVPDDALPPPSIEIPSEVRDMLVHLVLPMARPGSTEFAFQSDDGGQDGVRYESRERAIADVVLRDAEMADVALGSLRLGLARDDAPAAGQVRLAVARVLERRAGGALLLDESWIAPSLDCRAVPPLQALLMEARHLLRHRADAIAERLSSAAQRGQGEWSELQMLQVANRVEAGLAHGVERPCWHPEALYAMLAQAAGELATFDVAGGRRLRSLPPYRHDDLRGCLQAVLGELRALLADASRPHAVPVPLHERAAGLYSGRVDEPDLLRDAAFVLAVRSDHPADVVRRQFPAQVKIGPSDRLRDLVRLHLPAIGLQALPVAPPCMPFYAGYTYFELQRDSALWPQLVANGQLALHVAGDFPGLALELWALRP